MSQEKTVQFVSFETKLALAPFISQWENYSRSANSDSNVTLQQSGKEGDFRYLAQHRNDVGEFKFVFTKASRSSKIPEVGIKAKQAGGYSIRQMQRTTKARADESKVFAFLLDPTASLEVFQSLSAISSLNIYEAYYENCQYAYILEFFVRNKDVVELKEKLAAAGTEGWVYKECSLIAN